MPDDRPLLSRQQLAQQCLDLKIHWEIQDSLAHSAAASILETLRNEQEDRKNPRVNLLDSLVNGYPAPITSLPMDESTLNDLTQLLTVVLPALARGEVISREDEGLLGFAKPPKDMRRPDLSYIGKAVHLLRDMAAQYVEQDCAAYEDKIAKKIRGKQVGADTAESKERPLEGLYKDQANVLLDIQDRICAMPPPERIPDSNPPSGEARGMTRP